MQDIGVAFAGEVPRFASGLALLIIGWLVGQRLTVSWNLRQKYKEIDLATARDFHALYGEFFAIWKLWDYYLRDAHVKAEGPAGTCWTAPALAKEIWNPFSYDLRRRGRSRATISKSWGASGSCTKSCGSAYE